MAVKSFSDIQTELGKGFTGMFRGLFKDLVDSLVSSSSDLPGMVANASAPTVKAHSRWHVGNTLDFIIATVNVAVPASSGSGNAVVQGTPSNMTVNTTLAEVTCDFPGTIPCLLSGALRLRQGNAANKILRMNIEVNGSIVVSSQAQSQAQNAVHFHIAELETDLSNGDVVRMTVENQTDTVNAEGEGFLKSSGLAGAVNPESGLLVVASI